MCQGRGLRDPEGKDWRVPTAQLHGVSEESGPPHSARTLMSKELPMGVSVQKHDWQTHHVLTELSSRISIPILSLEVYLISLSMQYNYLITSLVLPAWSAPIQRWSRSSSIIYKWSHLISKSQAPVPGTNHDKDTLHLGNPKLLQIPLQKPKRKTKSFTIQYLLASIFAHPEYSNSTGLTQSP